MTLYHQVLKNTLEICFDYIKSLFDYSDQDKKFLFALKTKHLFKTDLTCVTTQSQLLQDLICNLLAKFSHLIGCTKMVQDISNEPLHVKLLEYVLPA